MSPAPSPLVEGQFDPTRSLFVFICGKKGTGKTELAKRLFRSYPYDRLAIDPTHDMDDLGDAVVDVDELPRVFPEPDDGQRRSSLRYLPDPGSPTYLDDLDRAVGLGFYNPRRRTLVLADEWSDVAPVGKVGPNGRRALRMGRHRNLTLVMTDPRTIGVDPLSISQADVVYAFKLPHPRDQERLAACIGWPERDLRRRMHELGDYEYLRYDAAAEELTHWPPIPLGDQTRTSTAV